MHVGVEEAVAQRMAQEHLQHAGAQSLAVVTCGINGGEVAK